MFESSLIASAQTFAPRRRGATVAAVGLQLTAAAIVLLLPLVHPEILPHSLPAMALTPPRLPSPARPATVAPRPRAVSSDARTTLSTPANTVPASSAPRVSPSSTAPATSNAPIVAGALDLGLEPGSGDASGILSRLGSGSSGPRIGVASPAPAHTVGPLHISGGVSAGMLLAPIQPVYPTIAKATRTEGTVVVEAIISKSGLIERAHAVSGPAMLQGAALEAITRARYRPYLLNGEPAEVQTTFTVNFKMQ